MYYLSVGDVSLNSHFTSCTLEIEICALAFWCYLQRLWVNTVGNRRKCCPWSELGAAGASVDRWDFYLTAIFITCLDMINRLYSIRNILPCLFLLHQSASNNRQTCSSTCVFSDCLGKYFPLCRGEGSASVFSTVLLKLSESASLFRFRNSCT